MTDVTERFDALFKIENGADVFDTQAVADMLSLRALDPKRFEELLEHIRTLKIRGGGVDRVLRNLNKVERDLRREEKRKGKAGGREAEAGEDGFIRTAEGAITTSAHNVRNALQLMGVHLRFDLFANRAVYINRDERRNSDEYLQVDDAFLETYWVRMDDEFGFSPNFSQMWKYTVFETARRDSYHPVLDKLRELQWDGVNRIDTWLVDYCYVEDTLFNRAVGALMLRAAYKRLLSPGCKFDTALMMTGPQGMGKSTAIKILALDEDWWTDSMPLQDSEQKIIESSQGKWIVEVGEMRGRDRMSVDAVKAQLSRTHDRARLAYGHIASDWPRQFVMFITSNPKNVLSDVTGNRRFWPVEINKHVDLAGLAGVVEQLWAEAVFYVDYVDQDVMLPEALWDDARLLQEESMVTNPYLERFESIIGDDVRGYISSDELWEVLGVNVNSRTRFELFGSALEKLGFVRSRRKYNGIRNVSCYIRWGDNDGPHPVELYIDRGGLDNRIRGIAPRVLIEDHSHDDDGDSVE